MSWTVAAGTETPPGPRTWPVIDPVAGAWPESKEGSIQANAKRIEERRMHFIELVNIPGTLTCCPCLSLQRIRTIINLAGLQSDPSTFEGFAFAYLLCYPHGEKREGY